MILKFAKQFLIKTAKHNTKNITADSIPWLKNKYKKQLTNWGHDYPVEGNPPAWVKSEKTWDEAKKAVRKEWDKYKEPWAVVADIYEEMGGKVKKK